jgi:hypothetical protein
MLATIFSCGPAASRNASSTFAVSNVMTASQPAIRWCSSATGSVSLAPCTTVAPAATNWSIAGCGTGPVTAIFTPATFTPATFTTSTLTTATFTTMILT